MKTPTIAVFVLSSCLCLGLASGVVVPGLSHVGGEIESVRVPVRVDDEKVDYVGDVKFALDVLEEKCGHFFKLKGIKWKKVRSEFSKAAKKVKTDGEHFALLQRLMARVRDGHAAVELTESNSSFEYPEDLFPARKGPGLFLCRVGKRYYIRNAYKPATELGLKPGMEVLKINKEKIGKWAEARKEQLEDLRSFSTDHQAEMYALQWGMAHTPDTRLKLELKDESGKTVKRTVSCTAKSYTPEGPVTYPGSVKTTKDLRWLRLDSGLGYLHVRRCKSNIDEQMDEALADLGDVGGLVLDFRGNSGGAFDHDDLFGRFVPKGKDFQGSHKKYPSTGDHPYGGPVVVIVDGTCRSAGETGSGMFKEEGRAYMIGESPTAGMSAAKERAELPSGLFRLYFAVRSNKAYWQGGRGIEGIGVEPHEVAPMDPDLLLGGKDPQIERALALLADFPDGKVLYDPGKYGWEPSKEEAPQKAK